MNGEQAAQSAATDRWAEMLATAAALEGKINVATARFDAAFDRWKKASETLFGFKDGHEARLAAIERDYVNRQQFERHEDRLELRLKSFEENQDRIKTSVIRVVAYGGAILTVANLAISLWRAMQ